MPPTNPTYPPEFRREAIRLVRASEEEHPIPRIARKNDRLDALATALAASRNERLAAVDPESDSEAMRLLSERREDLVAERTRALKAACTGFYETSSPAG